MNGISCGDQSAVENDEDRQSEFKWFDPLLEICNSGSAKSDGLMSGIAPDRRSGYKLIPQSNSENSELSDDELSGFYKDGFQIITKKRVYASEPTIESKTVENRVYTKVMQAETNDIKSGNQVLSAHTTQEVAFQKTPAMSMKRKFSFSLSVFTCFFVSALFLAIPCEWANCSCTLNENKTHELWKISIPNTELTGHIVLVLTKDGFNMNFLLMARGSIFADAPVIRTNFTSSSGGDIIAFHGLSGNQLWRKHYNKMPSEIDCKLFSVHNQLPKDCVVVSYGNYVNVISTETGRAIWNVPMNVRNNKTKEVFPVIIPDVDNDNVLDLVWIRDVNKTQLVSGFNGTVLNNDFHAISQNCSEIKNLRMHNEFMLKLDCKEDESFTEIDLPLQAHLTKASLNSKQILSQHHSFASLNRMYVHNYTIQFRNNGTLCPKHCEGKIWIRKDRKTVWSYEAENSFIMTPVTFDLNYTAGIFGFVIKTWEFEYELKKSKSFPYDAHKLTCSSLRERITIIAFNDSMDEPVRVINMTQNSILQLYDAHKSIQPDPSVQQHSLIVDDVTRDGSRHLITYFSSYEADSNFTRTDHTLKSYIQMYDLLMEIRRNFRD